MKKNNIYPVFLFLMIITLASCNISFEDLKQNVNVPNAVPPSLLLTGVLNDLHEEPFGDNEKWSQYYLINYDYYGNNRYDFGSGKDYYTTLKNVVKMDEEASTLTKSEVTAYGALSDFLKAYFFSKLSLEMGDVPMSEALKGIDNLTPKYDTQKAVFVQSFVWLESANTKLASLIAANESPLKGDFYYNNDLTKWQKLVNTFRLRLLIHLSNKTADTDLKVKDQVAALLGNPAKYPLMVSTGDNLQYNYIYPTNNYPNNPSNFGNDGSRNNCSDTYVGLLTRLHDPRVYATSEPAKALADSIGSTTDFKAFKGANPGEDLGSMYIKSNSGKYSLLNRYRYYRTYTAEPSLEISYQEMCFNIAEAINRGWVVSGVLGNAENYYIAGIKASMAFFDIPESGNLVVHFFKPSAGISDADPYNEYTVPVDWSTYYNQGTVKYSGNNVAGLKQILEQRYLALFRHSGLESYFTFRRTGIPTFETGPGTGNSGRIAMRFQYPSNEKNTNSANYSAALKAQGFGDNDDINGIMWILK